MMEFFATIGQELTPDVVTGIMALLFLILFAAISALVAGARKNDTTASLSRIWKMIDGQVVNAVITVAAKGEEQQVSKIDAKKYELQLGHPVDWRMVLVLKRVEAFIEKQLPVDVDLPTIYYMAEAYYQERFGGWEEDDESIDLATLEAWVDQ